MSKQLTILFESMDGVGHVNACIGLAEALQSRGHKIIFVVSQEYKGKLSRYGFIEELLENEEKEQKGMKPGENAAKQLNESGFLLYKSPLDKLKSMTESDIFQKMVDRAFKVDSQMKRIVSKYEPDIIVIDDFIGYPALIYSGKPWVYLWSGNPLFAIRDERTPPFASGLPSNGDRNSKEWKEFRELSVNLFTKYSKQYNVLLKNNGFPTIDNNNLIPNSPYLNIYGYPEELDYTDIRPIPAKWLRVDALERKGEQEFTLPDEMKIRDRKSQKLIYLSLGSMGSANIDLMKRLVSILSKSPHKVIVSKGVLGDKYELADNMWGANSVPQTKVLPFVDLVITHGGNNTVTETMSAGKPMIVMPLFGDQFDNAQRIQEKGFGIRMDGHNCTEEELLGAVKKIFSDIDMKNRVTAVSQRMAKCQTLVKASEMIEKLIKS